MHDSNAGQPATIAGAPEFIIPLAFIVPILGFWRENFRLIAVRSAGDELTHYAARPLQPFNDLAAKTPLYSASPGDVWVSELEPGEHVFYEYLGTYRAVEFLPDDNYSEGCVRLEHVEFPS